MANRYQLKALPSRLTRITNQTSDFIQIAKDDLNTHFQSLLGLIKRNLVLDLEDPWPFPPSFITNSYPFTCRLNLS